MFVGADRRASIYEILALFDQVRTDSRSRIVTVHGGLGTGKTRVIQEVYAQLAARQEVDPKHGVYWPARIDIGFEGSERLRRKIVRPTVFSTTSKVRMPWMWWGIACDAREHGAASQVLADDITQLQAHLAELLAREQISTVRRGAAKTLLESLLEDAVPLGATINLLRELLPGLLSYAPWKRAKSRDELDDVDDVGRETLIEELIALLELLDDTGLVTVVAIDDAQDADESMLAFLDAVLRDERVGSVLCVATLRPVGRAAGYCERYSEWHARLAREHPQRCAPDIDLTPLEPRACLEIVSRRAPSMAQATASRIATRADGNPLVLEGMLETAKMQRRIQRNQPFQLLDSEVDTLPNSYDDLMRDRWELLPGGTQEALGIAALQGRAFVESFLRECYGAVMPTGAPELERLLRIAEDPHGWVRTTDPLLVFSEPYAYEMARAMSERVLWWEESRTVTAMLLERAAELRDGDDWSSLDEVTRKTVLELHVQLAIDAQTSEPPVPVDLEQAGWSAYLSVAQLVRAGAPRTALARARLACEWLAGSAADPRALIAARNAYAVRLAADGQLEAAKAELRALIDELQASRAPRSDVDAVEHNLVALDATVEAACGVMIRLAEALGPMAPDTTTARQTYAHALFGEQRFRAARAEAAMVVRAREAEQPRDVRRVLEARFEHAGYIAAADPSDNDRRASCDALAAAIDEAESSLDVGDVLLRDARTVVARLMSLGT